MVRHHFASALLALVISGFNASTFAADVPIKAPASQMSPQVAAYDWSGFYLGGYWGQAIGQSSAQTNSNPGNAAILGSVDINKSGWTAGAAAGVNWQFAPSWLIGLEGDIGYLGIDRSFDEWNDEDVKAGVKTDWYATLRARVGYVTGPSLLYATGGVAFAHIKNTFGGYASNGLAPTTDATTKSGWALGGGIETKLSRNWSAKTEYLYIDAGSTSFTTEPYSVPSTATFKHQFHVIKTGINYVFGGPDEGLPFFNGAILPTNHNWAGLYAGFNMGGGLSTTRVPVAWQNSAPSNTDVNGGGFTGGVQLGYNVMNLFGQNWFGGIEGDIGYLGIDRSIVEWNEGGLTLSQKTNWYGTLRGRVGTTTGPALLYGTGGVALVRVRDGVSVPFQNAVDIRSETKTGWTLGGGTEVALDARWSAKLEYLYIDAGKSRRGEVAGYDTDFEHEFHVVRFGLNYSFSDPVAAKY